MQFNIIAIPCRLAHLQDIETVMLACCVLHNIISDHRGYKGTMQFKRALKKRDRDMNLISVSNVDKVKCRYKRAAAWRSELDGMENHTRYEASMEALIKNIWRTSGEIQNSDDRVELDRNSNRDSEDILSQE